MITDMCTEFCIDVSAMCTATNTDMCVDMCMGHVNGSKGTTLMPCHLPLNTVPKLPYAMHEMISTSLHVTMRPFIDVWIPSLPYASSFSSRWCTYVYGHWMDMWMDLWDGHVYGHVHGHVYGNVHGRHTQTCLHPICATDMGTDT